ncbi:hypothetical protein BSKO_09101 [Bryopsis sp. KO-2023]|nr:hypothetical protein BSKO_09101 [Bryopsis sp. KO-2023]
MKQTAMTDFLETPAHLCHRKPSTRSWSDCSRPLRVSEKGERMGDQSIGKYKMPSDQCKDSLNSIEKKREELVSFGMQKIHQLCSEFLAEAMGDVRTEDAELAEE